MKNLTIVSGHSGSGKTTALHSLEDLGYSCIDGLPYFLLNNMLEEIYSSYNDVAVSLDVRNFPKNHQDFSTLIKELKSTYPACHIIFLKSHEQNLLQRYGLTRRRHPLADEKTSLSEAIEKEEELLRPIQNEADFVLDTSQLSPHQLRHDVQQYVSKKEKPQLTLLFQSFGFKKGSPNASDFVFDVRCLPNPYWHPELRAYNGKDKAIHEYFSKQPQIDEMKNDIIQFVEKWIPSFETEQRSYLTVAIGCTGGQHRSVYFAEEIADYFKKKNRDIQIRHRDLT